MPERTAEQLLETKLAALLVPPEDLNLEYHAVTLTGEPDGAMTMGYMCTSWVGWQDDRYRVELRESDPVSAHYVRVFEALKLPCLYIVTDLQLLMFLRAGGAALIEKELAEAYFPALTRPLPSYALGRAGFVGERMLSEGAQRRKLTKKQRLAILTRDDGRCRMCERDPADFVDMELEIHHIRPWAMAGTSDPSNLITLCRKCHKSLKPHFNRRLFDQVEQRDSFAHYARFAQGVEEYRRTNPLAA